MPLAQLPVEYEGDRDLTPGCGKHRLGYTASLFDTPQSATVHHHSVHVLSAGLLYMPLSCLAYTPHPRLDSQIHHPSHSFVELPHSSVVVCGVLTSHILLLSQQGTQAFVCTRGWQIWSW